MSEDENINVHGDVEDTPSNDGEVVSCWRSGTPRRDDLRSLKMLTMLYCVAPPTFISPTFVMPPSHPLSVAPSLTLTFPCNTPHW